MDGGLKNEQDPPRVVVRSRVSLCLLARASLARLSFFAPVRLLAFRPFSRVLGALVVLAFSALSCRRVLPVVVRVLVPASRCGFAFASRFAVVVRVSFVLPPVISGGRRTTCGAKLAPFFSISAALPIDFVA